MSFRYLDQRAILILTILGSLFLSACTQAVETAEHPELWQSHLTAADIKDGEIVEKETIYVPSYSCIYFENRNRKLELAETLSFRNTDLNGTIYLRSVNYHGSDGKLIKSYLANPVALGPLATADFVVPRLSIEAGAGANFVIDWVSKEQVTDPIAESVMVSTGSSRNLSFVSRGVVIARETKSAKVGEIVKPGTVTAPQSNSGAKPKSEK